MGRLKHAFKVPGFFSFKFWVARVGGGFFYFSFIPNMFLQVPNGSLSNAHWVPNVSPNGVPNSKLL
jgi:hypothetical protein